MSVRRSDYREVKPTEDERAAWAKKYGTRSPTYRVEHIPCGKRMWYSGIGVGSHARACPGRRVSV
jgi:hypothetical protein